MDWANFKVTNSDGNVFFVYMFVLLLGFSHAMFALFVDCCSLQNFYDNMRHVVMTNSAGQRHFKLESVDFAAHYGFRLQACLLYRPWVKGKVKRPIDPQLASHSKLLQRLIKRTSIDFLEKIQ